MAFNGSGVFNRLYNWVNDAAASIKIRADRMDAEMDGIATGLSTCITKNGQTTITANLPMATYRHTGVGAGVNRTDYARLDQVQDGLLNWVDGGGTADAITASYVIPITALVDGQICCVRATAANATTTPTFAPNGLTARTIVKNGGSALVAGDISGDGHELILRYLLASTRWELLNPATPVIPANSIAFSKLDADFLDDATEVVVAADDNILIGDTSDGGNTKRDTVQGILDLVQVGIPLSRTESTAITFAAADNGKFVLHPSSDTSARTWTIDSNANLALVVGTCITIKNQNSAGVLTIAITSDTLRWSGPGTTGSRTLAANGIATIHKETSTEWTITGTGLT